MQRGVIGQLDLASALPYIHARSSGLGPVYLSSWRQSGQKLLLAAVYTCDSASPGSFVRAGSRPADGYPRVRSLSRPLMYQLPNSVKLQSLFITFAHTGAKSKFDTRARKIREPSRSDAACSSPRADWMRRQFDTRTSAASCRRNSNLVPMKSRSVSEARTTRAIVGKKSVGIARIRCVRIWILQSFSL